MSTRQNGQGTYLWANGDKYEGQWEDDKMVDKSKMILASGKGKTEDLPTFVSDIESKLPKTRVKNPDAIAVVIGNRAYKKVKNVDYAINDARVIKKYLTNVLGYREGNVFLVEDAAQSDFALYFGNERDFKGKLYNAIKAGKSDVFVYYSGHGAPGLKDKKGYFVPVEADPQYLEQTGYSADVFFSNVSKLPARSLTIVIDACFSGASIYNKISPMVIDVSNPMLSLKKGIVFSSSTGSQVSSWYDEEKHSMFTYFFLKTIHNKNADINGDNRLSYEEIYKYVSDKTEGVPYYARRINGIEQNPTIEGEYQGKVFVEY